MARMDPWIAEFEEIIDLSVSLFAGRFESGPHIAVVFGLMLSISGDIA